MGMSKSQEHLIEERNHQLDRDKGHEPHLVHPSARHSEMAISEHGMNQQSDQDKHNLPPKGAPKH